MSLNEAQQRAYETDHSHVLALAGAGTGKTHLMINRIHRIASEYGANCILALTFTNAAALEMSERYKKLSDECPTFQTFHAFCYSLLSSDIHIQKELGYSSAPEIVEEETINKIKLHVKDAYSIKLSNKKLESSTPPSNLKDRNYYDIYHAALRRMFQQHNVISFDMLINNVAKLFIEKNPIVDRYHRRYRYIFIDEFQDTDPLQWEFAQSFEDTDIFVVGDSQQAIYGFRGADSSIIKSLASDDSWQTIKLYENYRSTMPIIEYANSITAKADDAYRVELKGHKDGLPVSEIVEYRKSTLDVISDDVLQKVVEFCDVTAGGTAAILVRTNREADEVRAYLDMKDIRYSSTNENTFAIDVLKSVLDSQYEYDWILSSMKQEDNIRMQRLMLLEDSGDDPVHMLLNFESCPNVAKIRHSLVCKITGILSDESEFPFLRCETVLNFFCIKGVTVLPEEDSMEYLASYLLDAISSIEPNELYVGTIHSSKGLEYDKVCVLGVGGPSFKLNTEEDRNLYYVGVTRARSNLLVVHGDPK